MQQQHSRKKDITVTTQATHLIIYGDALSTTSIFSQITPNLICMGKGQSGKQEVMVMWGMG